jgi:hypothetical protein
MQRQHLLDLSRANPDATLLSKRHLKGGDTKTQLQERAFPTVLYTNAKAHRTTTHQAVQALLCDFLVGLHGLEQLPQSSKLRVRWDT